MVEYVRDSFYRAGVDSATVEAAVSCRHCVRGLDGYLARDREHFFGLSRLGLDGYIVRP